MPRRAVRLRGFHSMAGWIKRRGGATGMDAAVDDLNAFLDALMVDQDILPEQLALFGFSQGTMMSLHVALAERIRSQVLWLFLVV